MKKWTRQELKLLRSYDNAVNSYAATPDVVKDSITEQQILVFEAKLCTINKSVIGYVGNEVVGIFTFTEASKQESYYISQQKLFTYHPVNFPNMKHYVSFLNKKIFI